MTTAGFPRGKILVVDDHLDLAENIADILAGAGYQAAFAGSAEEGLREIESGDVVALITDFRLPGRNGAELIAELRRRGSHIPAVVMSAFTDDETIERARAAGALDVLPKPVDIGRLMATVEGLGRDDAMVLVVEDNAALAENLAEALRSRGYVPVVSGSVAEALAARGRARAALVDFRLPDGTGVEVAEQLAARNPTVRILFMSGFADELRARLRGRVQQAEHLAKPVDVERLLAWVAAALGNGTSERPHS